MMKNIFLIPFLIFTAALAAQYPKVEIPGSERRIITSTKVAGQEYEIQVLLPAGYKSSGKKYPVVYLMDSQWDFPLVKSIYGQQYYDGFIPELIIAGITWGGINPNPDSLRVRDYTPVKDNRQPQSGGADHFLSFIKEELFPFMENNYNADRENRIMMGCSLGGLLTLYTLFMYPDLFTGYIGASPAVGWANEAIYQFEKLFAAKKLTSPVRVYFTAGDAERSRSTVEKFARQMVSRNYYHVNLQTKVLENTGHSGTKNETYSRGLQFVFERNNLKLSDKALNRYTGTYLFSNGQKVEIRNNENQLFLYFSPLNIVPLYVNSVQHLYATQEFLNLYFNETNDKITGCSLSVYGSTRMLSKLN
jgi:predicted alpha/beta superfamily hydrolase